MQKTSSEQMRFMLPSSHPDRRDRSRNHAVVSDPVQSFPSVSRKESGRGLVQPSLSDQEANCSRLMAHTKSHFDG